MISNCDLFGFLSFVIRSTVRRHNERLLITGPVWTSEKQTYSIIVYGESILNANREYDLYYK